MKIKILSLSILAACVLVMVPMAPSVESAAVHNVDNAYILTQLKTIDHNRLKEKLQNNDINKHPLPIIKKLIEILNNNFHIVLPGIVIILLFYLGFFLQEIAIGPFLYILGEYMQFFVVVFIEIIHALGMEIYWPYPI